MIYLLFSLVIGISSAVLVWAIFMLEKDLSPNTLRRLERIKRKSNLTDEAFEEIDLSQTAKQYQTPIGERLFKGLPISEKIGELIQKADSSLKIDTLIFLSLFCALPFLAFLSSPYQVVALIGFATFFIPTIYLNSLIEKRYVEFSKQFPDALNLMASSLRAGHPLFAAIDIVTEEMPKPICTIFDTAKKDISLGRDTKDAFYHMAELVPKSLDLRLFVTAVLIQKEAGGNLAELLDKLSETIRERFKLQGVLRVQTAQSRISGTILSIVPFLVFGVIFFMNPEYVKPLYTTPDGQKALTLAVVLVLLGIASIKKISSIEM